MFNACTFKVLLLSLSELITTFSLSQRAMPSTIAAAVTPRQTISTPQQNASRVTKPITTTPQIHRIPCWVFQPTAHNVTPRIRDGNLPNTANTTPDRFPFIQVNTMENGTIAQIVIRTPPRMLSLPVLIAMNTISLI